MGFEALIANMKSTGVFILVLSVLIVVHEWGHFITAKKLGVDVEKFSLGFGPKLFSKIYNGTEYLICAIPLGGYVKMAGDERDACKGTPEEYYSQSVGHRALIILNGPVVNFLLAYICLVFVFMLGYPDLAAKVGKLIDDYPAQEAGLQLGDEIVRINDTQIENWTDLQTTIAESQTKTLEIEIIREKQNIVKVITPRVVERKNIFGQMQTVRQIGIAPEAEAMVSLKYDFGTSIIKAYEKLEEITVLTYKSLYFMITGSMSAKESVTGPIGIFYIVKSAAEMGMSHLLFIVGVISASLAIFNLLPIIPLDGGHLFLLSIEKLRGQALPAKVDDFVARLGVSFIILLAIFVFYNDFERFGWIEKFMKIFT